VLTWECDPTRRRYSDGDRVTNNFIDRMLVTGTTRRTEISEAEGDEGCLQQGHSVSREMQRNGSKCTDLVL